MRKQLSTVKRRLQRSKRSRNKAAMTASRNERIAAMNSQVTELPKKRQDMMKHMNFYRRSIYVGNPSASSMKFAAALKELREATEKSSQNSSSLCPRKCGDIC